MRKGRKITLERAWWERGAEGRKKKKETKAGGKEMMERYKTEMHCLFLDSLSYFSLSEA